ncbi:MAG TPA: sulfotransferase domain-containing protein, partial [Thermomicrobiales bacterium]|nr:sulfotransferase domain-containing protein [Thermomicrobiales bacterium]
IYGLDWLMGDDTPVTKAHQFVGWIQRGNFQDDTIFHQHCKYKPQLCNVIDAVPAHIVTIVRDPYDTFVSMYYWLQSRKVHDETKGRVRGKERPRDVLVGKSLADPAILDFLSGEFGIYIDRAVEWTESGRALVVRYEDLHRDTFGTMKEMTELIAPADDARVRRAIVTCHADNMRKMSPKMAQHIRSAKVGDSKERLGPEHLAIFRERYGDQVRRLGYEVR